MTDPETRQPTRREALIQRMLFRAETWERGTYGDQGLRLMAEDSAKLLRDAADLLREEPYERNGIRHGERVVCVDVPRLFGTVIRCAPDGVDVRWDDGKLGELVWRDDVAYNAFRLQVVRADLLREEGEALKRYDLVTNYRCGSSIEEMEPSDDGEWVRYEQVADRLTSRVDPVPPPPHQDKQNA